MSPNEDLLHRMLQAFNRGYAGAPGVSRPRQMGKTAAGVQAVIDLLQSDASQPQGDVCSCPEHGSWYHAEDIDRMVKEISDALGSTATHPKLCDIVVETVRAIAPQGSPIGWKLVPVEPTAEILGAAAASVWPVASNDDLKLAAKAAMIVLKTSMVAMPGVTLMEIAATIATMAPAYRAMIAAAPGASNGH